MKYQDNHTGEIVEAIQWDCDGDSEYAIKQLVRWPLVPWEEHDKSPDFLCIRTLTKDIYVDIDDWVIKHKDGRVGVVSNKVFGIFFTEMI